MGAYHGRHSIETFSHDKSVINRPTFLDPALAYPRMTRSKAKWLKWLT